MAEGWGRAPLVALDGVCHRCGAQNRRCRGRFDPHPHADGAPVRIMPPDAALVCVVVAQPRPGKYFLGAGEFENGTDKRLLLCRTPVYYLIGCLML